MFNIIVSFMAVFTHVLTRLHIRILRTCLTCRVWYTIETMESLSSKLLDVCTSCIIGPVTFFRYFFSCYFFSVTFFPVTFYPLLFSCYFLSYNLPGSVNNLRPIRPQSRCGKPGYFNQFSVFSVSLSSWQLHWWETTSISMYKLLADFIVNALFFSCK